jgi:Protein of unknown function (DUF1479)
VIYIPVCPTTEPNAEYLAAQRETFIKGFPGPDFPGGKGEEDHSGRPTVDYLQKYSTKEGLQAMGLEKFDVPHINARADMTELFSRVNQILKF